MPLLAMIFDAVGHPIQLPQIELSDMWPALLGMLGLGGLGTIERVQRAKQ